MSHPFLILLLGFLYAVLFGFVSLLRRDALSVRFAVESILITLTAAALSYFTGTEYNPVFFLAVLYLITMRVRFIVDIGIFLAGQGKLESASKVFEFGMKIFPDAPGRTLVRLNQAILLLHRGRADESIEALKELLTSGEHLSPKNESAAHYNLALAYLKKNQESKAIDELNAVLSTHPGSIYARRAETRLASLQNPKKL
ncbi:MAG: tetratricopeptide repeat protein [Chloroflexi bacterium]|nr:MAG: tetratricopeptide repeat protein [Chloroflexota bacterium]